MKWEDDIRGFFVLIVQTLSMIILFVMVNITLGLFFNLAFFEGSIHIKNILYYLFFLGSLIFLIRYIIKKWNTNSF